VAALKVLQRSHGSRAYSKHAFHRSKCAHAHTHRWPMHMLPYHPHPPSSLPLAPPPRPPPPPPLPPPPPPPPPHWPRKEDSKRKATQQDGEEEHERASGPPSTPSPARSSAVVHPAPAAAAAAVIQGLDGRFKAQEERFEARSKAQDVVIQGLLTILEATVEKAAGGQTRVVVKTGTAGATPDGGASATAELPSAGRVGVGGRRC